MATGTIDDLIKLTQELLDLTRVSADNQKAVHHILQNPDLKTGGPYTAAGRWMERQKSWLPFARNAAGKGKNLGGGRLGGAVLRGLGKRLKNSALGDFAGGIGKNLGRMRSAVRKRGLLGAAGQAIGGKVGGRIGAGIGAAGGAVVGGAVALGVALYEANKVLGQWTDSMMESNRQLAEVSGSMAAVMAERDMRQMQRDIQKGEATAGSARGLMEAESKRKDAENRISIVATNAINAVLEVLNDIASSILEPIADAVEWIAENGFGMKKGGGGEWEGVGGAVKNAWEQRNEVHKAGIKLMDKARDAAREGAAGPAGALPIGRVARP